MQLVSPVKRALQLTLALSLSLTLVWVVPAHAATTVTFGDNTGDDVPGTVEDALIWQKSDESDWNYGQKPTNPVGERATLGRARRSLIRFKDIVYNLPPDIVITSATMYLYCSLEDSSADHGISAYRVLLDWVEGDSNGAIESGAVCWNYAQHTGLSWNATGCDAADDGTGEDSTADRTATAEASTLITGTGWFAWDLTTAVQNWYSGDWSEYGVILINDDEDTAECRKIFESSESTNNGQRPYLEVTYDDVPVPPSTDPAHTDVSYGVNRTGAGYETGDCAHCHDAFNEVTCSENQLMLFFPLFTSQTDSVCFQCHRDSDGSAQANMPVQYNYSDKFGGDTNIDCPSDIKAAFSFVGEDGAPQDQCDSTVGSAHYLTDIKSFLQGRWGFGDSFEEINPCSGCHNPHQAQRHGYPVGSQGSSPISLPSTHANDWNVYGANATERMNNKATALGGIYQAPFRYNSSYIYEPDGSSTTDGSNMPDYVTLCLDCHSEQVYSTGREGTLYAINWGPDSGDVHGGNTQDCCDYGDKKSPYLENTNYVLSCLDCHEPHGSQNMMLLREEVNGTHVGAVQWERGGNGYNTSMEFCQACHTNMGSGTPDGKHLVYGWTTWPGVGCGVCHFHGKDITKSDCGDGGCVAKEF